MVKNLGARTLLIVVVLALSVFALYKWEPRYGIDLKGGSTLVYRVKPDESTGVTENAVNACIGVMQKRLDPQGLQASTFRALGKDQIEIQLAGADKAEVERVKNKLTQLGKLEFRIVAERDELAPAGIQFDDETKKRQDIEQKIKEAKDKGQIPPDPYVGPQPDKYRWFYYTPKESARATGVGEFLKMEPQYAVAGENLQKASQGSDSLGLPAVHFELKPDKAREMGTLTGNNVKRRMAIVLNGYIETAPVINSQISDQGIIEKPGGYDSKELKDMVEVLRAGSLPVKPELLHESTIGPTLGEESIRLGYLACLIAAGVTVLFMLIYYRLAGLIANVALILNLVLLVAIMVLFNATFTLPGIAGIVLTLGMAVDANILINERIREERAKGKTLLQALKNGYDRATIVILDAHITVVIAAIILYLAGTGPIQGFALTMIMGEAASLFTALFVTRTILAFLAEGGMIKELYMMHLFKKPNIQFFKIMWPAIGVSIAFMVVSLAVFFMRGDDKYGLDFTGGALVQMSLKEGRKVGEIRQTLEAMTIKDEKGNEKPKYPDAVVSAISVPGEELSEGDATHFSIQTPLAQKSGDDEGLLVRQFQDDIEKAYHELLVPKGFSAKSPIPIDTTDPALKPLGGGYEFELGVEGRVDATTVSKMLGDAQFTPPPVVKTLEQTETLTRFDVSAKHADPKVSGDPIEIERVVRRMAVADGLRLPDPFPVVQSTGPTVVKDLKNKAVLAIVLSLIAMTIYIRVRFKNLNWGLAASLCLFHDVIIALGFVVFFDWMGLIHARIDLNSIAAFLTIVGYSINDTIVIFDRVRENLGKMKGTLKEIINTSCNETLGRTILTSLTVLMVVTVLFFVNYGHGSELEGLSFALMVGTVFGTYSSIYIASPLAIAFENYAERRRRIIASAEGGDTGGDSARGKQPQPPKPRSSPNDGEPKSKESKKGGSGDVDAKSGPANPTSAKGEESRVSG
ncbi:MAG: protein translocase subunit SecD [Planctomycetes bacterium]|nr:protein translocase subunit SecD [Planctomycetota bacterium]